MRLILRCGIAVAAALLLATDGFAQTWSEVEAAANSEGTLVIYTTTHDQEMDAIKAEFQKAYPEITVNSIRLPSTQLFSRFVGEMDAGVVQADLLMSGSTALYQTRPELFSALTAENVPNLNQPVSLKPVNQNYMIFQADAHQITYNTSLVSEADIKAHLATWEGLADPFWKGSIAISDPQVSSNNVSFVLALRERYGDEWLSRLAANEFVMVATGSAGVQQVSAGAYKLLAPTITAQSAALRDQGAPIGVYLPGGFAHMLAQGIAIPEKAANKNAALVFLNWKLGKDAQALACKFGGIPVFEVAPDAGCTLKLPAEYVLARDIIPKDEQDAAVNLLGPR